MMLACVVVVCDPSCMRSLLVKSIMYDSACSSVILELWRVSWFLAIRLASVRLSECNVLNLSVRCVKFISFEWRTSFCIADLMSVKSVFILSRKSFEQSGGVIESAIRVRSLSIDFGMCSQLMFAWSKRAPWLIVLIKFVKSGFVDRNSVP